ncbi:hypothetical protein BCR34DRAFT_362563 [Clohesyomyces aquaticus]|uniref:Uncharacterized protein n=1 Tax=Clohesyomyces aquaticus TaxID=1231657 RepID=A0A1Y1ZHY6_9PLEO|nr:hypothetical protein BCR34DRAFT_362563 [Clohesyomyces aquaticus]
MAFSCPELSFESYVSKKGAKNGPQRNVGCSDHGSASVCITLRTLPHHTQACVVASWGAGAQGQAFRGRNIWLIFASIFRQCARFSLPRYTTSCVLVSFISLFVCHKRPNKLVQTLRASSGFRTIGWVNDAKHSVSGKENGPSCYQCTVSLLVLPSVNQQSSPLCSQVGVIIVSPQEHGIGRQRRKDDIELSLIRHLVIIAVHQSPEKR